MYRRSFLNALMSGAAFVAILGLSACGGSPASGPGGSTSGSQDSSDDISTLTVGFDQSYPPYGYVGDDGEFTGFDLDLAAEVAKRNGWDLELEPIDWDAKDTLLNSGAITCIWNGFTMENREDDYTFSAPYMLNKQVVVVRADSGIGSLEDLAGKTVLTQVDSAAEAVLNGDKADLTATFASPPAYVASKRSACTNRRYPSGFSRIMISPKVMILLTPRLPPFYTLAPVR